MDITSHPLFLALLAMSLAGGILMVWLIRYGSRLLGNNGELQYIRDTLAEIKNEVKAIKEAQISCRLDMQKYYVSRSEYDELRRNLLHHSHVDNKVVIDNR